MMEQPKVYNNEEELIKWLIYDLEEQHRKEVEYNELVLNFGNNELKINENRKILQCSNFTKYRNCFIRFDLILEKILEYFNIKEQYVYEENDFPYLICPFKVNISHCSFESTVIRFYRTIFEETVSFFNTIFYDEVCFNILKFIKSVDFDRVNFDCDKNVVFYDVNFKSKVDFSNLQWKNKLLFHNIASNFEFNLSELNIIDTLEIIEFNKNKEDNFTSIINLDNISFENSKSLLSITNITNKIKYISFKNIIVGGIINIQDVKTEKVNFKGSIVTSGAVNPVEFKIDEFENRESALFLKNEAYARNNIIDALEYKAKEIEMHKKELLKNKKDYKKWGDIISIYLSSLYSDNGLNWIKSFLCTILLPTFFFIASYIDYSISICMYALFIFYVINRLKFKDIAKYISNTILLYLFTFWLLPTIYLCLNIEFINELLKFFIPIDFEQIKNGKFIYYKNDIIEIILRGLSYYLGKVAFWYGSVQTVQSFRKFSKKE